MEVFRTNMDEVAALTGELLPQLQCGVVGFDILVAYLEVLGFKHSDWHGGEPRDEREEDVDTGQIYIGDPEEFLQVAKAVGLPNYDAVEVIMPIYGEDLGNIEKALRDNKVPRTDYQYIRLREDYYLALRDKRMAVYLKVSSVGL